MWTFLFTLVTCFIFAFMAGQYSTYQVKGQLTKVAAGSSTSFNINNITWGPPNLQHWLQFWQMAPDTMFDFDYLQVRCCRGRLVCRMPRAAAVCYWLHAPPLHDALLLAAGHMVRCWCSPALAAPPLLLPDTAA